MKLSQIELTLLVSGSIAFVSIFAIFFSEWRIGRKLNKTVIHRNDLIFVGCKKCDAVGFVKLDGTPSIGNVGPFEANACNCCSGAKGHWRYINDKEGCHQ